MSESKAHAEAIETLRERVAELERAWDCGGCTGTGNNKPYCPGMDDCAAAPDVKELMWEALEDRDE